MIEKQDRGKMRIITKFLHFLTEFVLTSIVAGTISVLILKTVYINRGYFAFGGEWLLIICLFVFIFYMIHERP